MRIAAVFAALAVGLVLLDQTGTTTHLRHDTIPVLTGALS